MNKTPSVLVFAGPNGSGKSTVTKGFDIIGEYINADDIKMVDMMSQKTKLSPAITNLSPIYQN